MLDGHNTTGDWQLHTGGICVLPIGSFEQHSSHLPLNTDNIIADFFARIVASELDGVLLPTLPLGTCLEHSGFRGSISLRPETLMQIIRDIADEIEQQNFKILIILNAHGGNFSLAPVVRDINRWDRTLKILLVSPGEFGVWSSADNYKVGLDIHAGEAETSVMLAIRPDLVRSTSQDRDETPHEAVPLRQSDLNTFGTGHFSPHGVVGYPSLASPQKGQYLIDSCREAMLSHLRDRVHRLQENPHYAGNGGIAYRQMTTDDIPAAMRLKTLAGWNQTEDDWQLFLHANPGGCCVAIHNGKVRGTVATINYGNIGWIGMLLVDPEFRRRRIGTQLLERAVQNLATCSTIKLDATPTGREVYSPMGFTEEYMLQRLTHHHWPSPPKSQSEDIVPVTDAMIDEIIKLDQQVFGAQRAPLLAALRQHDAASTWCLMQQGQVRGFCLGRPGSNFHQIGPVVAETFDAAQRLVTAATQRLAGQAVGLDVPLAQTEFMNWLHSLGFVAQRPFTRMYRGHNSSGISERQFAIAGPEFG